MTGIPDPRDCPYVGLDPFEKAYERFFFGREQDSRVIADHVVSRPITVLYGASGVGKSSVLNVGLPAALRRRAPWMIATLRDWQDPDAVEQHAIEALQAALPAGIKNSQGHARFPRQVVGALRATGQPLLLILDQFEEYFLYRTEGLLNSAEKALSELIARRDLDLHVLISLRDDSLHLLDNLRAIVPGILETTVRLGYLNDGAVEQAIRGPIDRYNEDYRKDATPIAVDDALVHTLIRDLRQIGGRPIDDVGGPQRGEPIELPYLQLTLTKLWFAEGGRNATALRAETLTKKLGGVQQIAREHVDRILSGLTTEEQALCADIFRNLVTSSGSKIAYPADDLAKQVSEDRKQAGRGHTDEIVVADDVAAVLRKLTPTETRLLKRVKANGVDAFELFHDVLGQPVLRWRQAFNANARLHTEQRRVRRARRLAFVFGLITFLAVLATGVAYLQTIGLRETLGRSIWSSLDFSQPFLTPSDVDGLWRVTELNGDERDGFLAPLTGRYFHRGPAVRFAAWVGASLRDIDLQMLDDAQPDPGLVKRFARRPLAVLRALGLQPLTEAQAQAAIDPILAAIKQTTDPYTLEALAQGLQALPAKLTDAQAQAAIDPILAAIRQTTSPYDLRTLAQGLQALTAKLTEAQAQAAIDPILAAIKQTTSPYDLQTLAQGLQALPAKLSDAQAQAAIDPILAAIKQTTSPDDLQTLAQGQQALAAKLTEAQAQAAIDPILAAIKQTTDPEALRTLAQGLQALPAKLTEAQAQAAIDPILAAMRQPYDLRTLAQGLRALTAKLTQAQAQATIDPILAAMKRTTDPYTLEALAQGLQALPAKLTDAQAQAAIDPILAAIKQTTQTIDPEALRTLAQGLQAVAAKLTEAQAQAAIDPILAAINQPIDPHTLEALAQGLQALPAKLADAQAQAAINPILATTRSGDLRMRAPVLQALAAKLTEAQAQAAIDPILAAMKQTTDPYTLEALAQGLQALPAKLTEAQAQAAIDPILAAIKQTTSPDALQTLAQGLQALPAKLTDAQAQAAIDPILAAIKQTTSPYDLRTLAQGLQALPAKLTDAQAQAAIDPILAAINKATSHDALLPLAQGLQALAAKLTDAQAPSLLLLARRYLASTGYEETAEAWAGAIAALAAHMRDNTAFLGAIVEVLKYPTAVGKPTGTLMAALRQRFPNVPELAGGLDAAVPWFEVRLGADVVARPPIRPQ